jgi:hypothetical protein
MLSPRVIDALGGHQKPITRIAMQGDLLITGSQDSTMRVWTLANGVEAPAKKLRPPTTRISAIVAVALSATVIAGANDERAVHVFDRKQMRPKVTSFASHAGKITCLATEGNTLVSGGTDGAVIVWRADENEVLFTLKGHEGAVTSLAIFFNTVVSGGADRTVRVWDIAAAGVCLVVLEGHTASVTQVRTTSSAVSFEITSASLDGTVRVWNVARKKCAAVVQLEGPIHALAVDDSRIVAGLRSGEIAVLAKGTYAVLARLRVSTKPVHDLAISGRFVATAALDAAKLIEFPAPEPKPSANALAAVPVTMPKQRVGSASSSSSTSRGNSAGLLSPKKKVPSMKNVVAEAAAAAGVSAGARQPSPKKKSGATQLVWRPSLFSIFISVPPPLLSPFCFALWILFSHIFSYPMISI